VTLNCSPPAVPPTYWSDVQTSSTRWAMIRSSSTPRQCFVLTTSLPLPTLADPVVTVGVPIVLASTVCALSSMSVASRPRIVAADPDGAFSSSCRSASVLSAAAFSTPFHPATLPWKPA
jgi:hypothetical protein